MSRLGKQKEQHPNEHIVFISALTDFDDSDDALHLLKGIAAGVKPICKSHGLKVTSLEEHEYNVEFAGRNWNAGESIELVLRGPDGRFRSPSWLFSVMCHELAHITNMHHGASFWATNKQYKQELAALQAKGYHGDGFWSDGVKLGSGSHVFGDSRVESLADVRYTCGGAHRQAKPGRSNRKKFRRFRYTTKLKGTVKSPSKTGRQPSHRTPANAAKPGTRNRKKGWDKLGDGNTLSADPEQSTFRKRATSKNAAELRVEAAEKRQRHETRRAAGLHSGTEDEEEDVDELQSEDEVVLIEVPDDEAAYPDLDELEDDSEDEQPRPAGKGGVGNSKSRDKVQLDSDSSDDEPVKKRSRGKKVVHCDSDEDERPAKKKTKKGRGKAKAEKGQKKLDDYIGDYLIPDADRALLAAEKSAWQRDENSRSSKNLSNSPSKSPERKSPVAGPSKATASKKASSSKQAAPASDSDSEIEFMGMSNAQKSPPKTTGRPTFTAAVQGPPSPRKPAPITSRAKPVPAASAGKTWTTSSGTLNGQPRPALPARGQAKSYISWTCLGCHEENSLKEGQCEFCLDPRI